jgi:site-specific DNA recombinase
LTCDNDTADSWEDGWNSTTADLPGVPSPPQATRRSQNETVPYATHADIRRRVRYRHEIRVRSRSSIHLPSTSRTDPGRNSHPQTARTYPLRSYVICDLCSRRTFGKSRRRLAYYVCEPDQRHHEERSGWYPGHPASLWVREDILLSLVHEFFTSRIFGPHRHDLLRTQLAIAGAARTPRKTDEQRTSQIRKAIADIERRKRSLVTELESQTATGDPDADREYRQAIQQRFTELVAEHRAKSAELAKHENTALEPTQADPGLLDALPQLPLQFTDIPEPLQRTLYEAFQIQVRYHRPRHEVTIRASIRAETQRAGVGVALVVGHP